MKKLSPARILLAFYCFTNKTLQDAADGAVQQVPPYFALPAQRRAK